MNFRMSNSKVGRFWCVAVVCCLISVVFNSCSIKRYIDDDERLVKDHELIFDKRYLSFNERINLSYELDTYMHPQPNTKVLGITYFWLWAHYRLDQDEESYKDTSANTWLEERFVEEPVYYMEDQISRNLRNLNYILYQKGFFDREIKVDTIFTKHFVTTKYNINTGPRYTVGKLNYESSDTAVLNLVKSAAKNSKLSPGAPVDNSLFEEEKLRIQNLILDNGYYGFNTSFIPNLSGDSTQNKVNLTIKILAPENMPAHEKYTIGNIRVFTDNDPLTVNHTDHDTLINGIRYYGGSEKFNVKPKTLDRQIYLESGKTYAKSLETLTIRRLNNLGYYRYPVLRTFKSETEENTIDYDIYLTPLDKLELETDFSVSRSNQTSSTPLLGLSADVGVYHRNLLRGAENFGIGVESSVELLPRAAQGLGIFNSAVFRVKNDLTLQRFIDFNGTYSLLRFAKIGKRSFLSNEFHDLLQIEGRSNMNISFDYNFIIEAYTTRSFNLTLNTLASTPDRRKSYAITQIGFNLLIPEATQDFRENFLANNPLLAQSFFNNQLFTGLLFKSFSFAYRPKENVFGETFKRNFNIETSGLEVLLLESILNKNLNPSFASFSKFIRLDYSTSYFRKFNNSFGAGVYGSAGLALPLWDDLGVPYVKKLQVGGPNSMRAWEYRQLGPGANIDTTAVDGQRLNNYFQRGDVKLEFMSEIRFDLFWVFKGALFLDVGNVWSLDKNDKPEVRFRASEFFKQFAVGSGLGLRMDFDYFVIRADFGTKLRLPYVSPVTNNHYPYRNIGEMARDIQLNLALDYPF